MKEVNGIVLAVILNIVALAIIAVKVSGQTVRTITKTVTVTKYQILDKCTDVPVAEQTIVKRALIACNNTWSGKMQYFTPADDNGRVISFTCANGN